MKDCTDVIFFVYKAPIAYNNGVALLSALLKDKGIRTSLFVGNGNLDEWVKYISESSESTIICFSHVIRKDFALSEPYIEASIATGRQVVFGGTFHRRNNPNKYDGKVLICRGDGEELVEYITGGNKSVFLERKITTDLNSLPLPDYDLFSSYPYDGNIKYFPELRKLPYTTSRGCIGSCAFCEVQHQYKVPRIRTKVQEDLEYLESKHDFDLVFITDELCPYYSKEWRDSWGNYRTPFFAFIRADIQPEILEWLIDRGLKGCAFGVETGDEKFRNDVMRKNVTNNDVRRTAKILTDNNIYFAHFYMLDYPGETFSHKLATQKMSLSLGGVPMVFDYTPVVYETRKD